MLPGGHTGLAVMVFLSGDPHLVLMLLPRLILQLLMLHLLLRGPPEEGLLLLLLGCW